MEQRESILDSPAMAASFVSLRFGLGAGRTGRAFGRHDEELLYVVVED